MKPKDVVTSLVFVLIVWVILGVTIDRFKNPDKTETQLFLSIPRSFLMKF